MMDLMFIYPISHISDFTIRSIRKNLISSYFLNMMFVFERKLRKNLR